MLYIVNNKNNIFLIINFKNKQYLNKNFLYLVFIASFIKNYILIIIIIIL